MKMDEDEMRAEELFGVFGVWVSVIGLYMSVTYCAGVEKLFSVIVSILGLGIFISLLVGAIESLRRQLRDLREEYEEREGWWKYWE